MTFLDLSRLHGQESPQASQGPSPSTSSFPAVFTLSGPFFSLVTQELSLTAAEQGKLGAPSSASFREVQSSIHRGHLKEATFKEEIEDTDGDRDVLVIPLLRGLR